MHHPRPLEARQLEARSRARQLGVRVHVIDARQVYEMRSQSRPDTSYQVVRTPIGWACTCPGFVHTGVCKHLAAVERRSERESWPFGRIAPRPQSVA
jgi:hypothetical protein